MRPEFPTPDDLVAYLRGTSAAPDRAALDALLAGDDALRRELERTRTVLQILDEASDEATVRRVNDYLARAIDGRASDVHLDLQREGGVVRLRIDGVLHVLDRLPAEAARATLSRLQQLLGLDLANQTGPQDGRFEITHDGRAYDLRGAFLPGLWGGRICLRIFDRSAVLVDWDRLGLLPVEDQALRRLIHAPCGLLVIAGPTGSGKTTLAYTVTRELASEQTNVLSVEDPVEIDLPWVAQTAVRPAEGLTPPVLLRAILRQDPDVIYADSLGDRETISQVIQLALTGHLVVATMHAHDAVGAVQRLLELGADPYLLSCSLVGLVGIRLARQVCAQCGADRPARNPAAVAQFGFDPKDFTCRFGDGCDACRHTGYRGRTGLYEVVEVTRALADAIALGAPEEVLREQAFAGELPDFRAHAATIIQAGLTTPEEAARVLSLD